MGKAYWCRRQGIIGIRNLPQNSGIPITFSDSAPVPIIPWPQGGHGAALLLFCADALLNTVNE